MYAIPSELNGFSLFGTRSSVLGHEFDGYDVGYVENLFSYRGEPFFEEVGRETTLSNMETVILDKIDF